METNIEIKKTVRAGNSSAVILPRAWLNQEVRVELIKKTPGIILQDILKITRKYLAPEKIIGIYITGSYARKEGNRESDIDILIISDGIDKEEIKDGIYSILIVSKDLLMWKLENDLFPVGPMIIEAVPLINSVYLETIRSLVAVTKKNVKWYIDTTGKKLGAIKEYIDKSERTVGNRVVYTLVLRIRTLQMIEKLARNQIPSNQELMSLISKISGSNNAYNAYLAHKNNVERKSLTKKEEATKLYDYLKGQLKKVKGILRY
ncbi:MAG: nucleotidyltransferase domain-containing protein [Candidatus Pacearchaeota archaeon]